MILNPYNFVPLNAHIKLEIHYSDELENRRSQEVNLIAINDIFTIHEINLDIKDKTFHMISRQKNLKLIGIKNFQSFQLSTIAKFLLLILQLLGILTLDFYIIPVLKNT